MPWTKTALELQTRIIMVSGHVLAKALLPLEGAVTLLACKFGSLMLGGHVQLKVMWSFAVLFTYSADISTSSFFMN